PVVDRRALAVHVAPPGGELRRTVALDFAAEDAGQMGFGGLGDERGDGRAGAPQLVIIVGRLVRLVGPERPPGRRGSRVERRGVLAFVPHQVAHRHASWIISIYGGPVGFASL